MNEYDLDDGQLREVFDKKIRPVLDESGRGQTAEPTCVVVGAQPGAGKTRVGRAIEDLHPGIVPVVGDDFRQYHPRYESIMKTNPVAMPEATAQASGAWVRMSLDYLRSIRSSVLLETTLRQPEVVAATLQSFRDAGYSTELQALAVPPEASRLGTVSRYMGQVADVGAGRWTPSQMHDAADRQALGTVHQLVGSGLVDRVVVTDRDARALGEWSPRGREDQAATEAVRTLEAGREVSSLSPQAARGWMAQLGRDVDTYRATGQSDPDLAATVRRLVDHDALKIEKVAYGDQQQQEFVHADLTARAQGISGTGSAAQRHTASFPAAAGSGSTPPRLSPPTLPRVHRDAGMFPARDAGR